MTTQDTLRRVEAALQEASSSMDWTRLWASKDLLLDRLAGELDAAALAEVDFSAGERQRLAKKGQAMPHGGYPIRNVGDLKRAIVAVGRAKDRAATIRWIKRRARALGATNLLPESWGSASQS